MRAALERIAGHRAAPTRGGDDPLSHLFDKQLEVVRDPTRIKALLCGGRAGKTSTAIYDFVAGMLSEPGQQNLYVGLTRPSAKNILWEPLRRLNERHRWGLVLNETELRARHPNGSWLLCVGADDRRELEKVRGVPWNKVRIDECGSHRPSYLQYLAEEVIEARLMDHNGTMWFLGTPTRQAYGYFYDLTTGKVPGVKRFKWTARDNPHVNFDSFIKEICERRGWSIDNPILQREYFAEWQVETEARVYRFDRARNTLRALPQLGPREQWQHVLAIDFGFGNATAWVVIAYRHGDRRAYVVHASKRAGLTPSEVAPITKRLIETHHPDQIVGDVGGLGKAYAVEFTSRYGIPITPADKLGRRAGIEVTSDALYTGSLLSLDCCEPLHAEWATLLWDETHTDVAAGQDDDIADAALYAFKATPAYMTRLVEPVTKDPSRDGFDDERDDPEWERKTVTRPYWDQD